MAQDGFRDRNDRFSFLIARENARRITHDPAVAEAGRQHLAKFSIPDPHQRAGVALWLQIFEKGPAEVVRCLLDRSPAGDYARQTAPSFGALPADLRKRLAIASCQPLPNGDDVA